MPEVSLVGVTTWFGEVSMGKPKLLPAKPRNSGHAINSDPFLGQACPAGLCG